MLAAFVAGSDVGGVTENLPDTFAMLRQSRTVLGIDLAVVLCVLAANIGGEQLSCCTFRLYRVLPLRLNKTCRLLDTYHIHCLLE